LALRRAKRRCRCRRYLTFGRPRASHPARSLACDRSVPIIGRILPMLTRRQVGCAIVAALASLAAPADATMVDIGDDTPNRITFDVGPLTSLAAAERFEPLLFSGLAAFGALGFGRRSGEVVMTVADGA